MSEMEYEEAPEVTVPRVRNWLNPALQSWYKSMYGHRGRFYIFSLWLLPFLLFYWVCKLMLYAGVGLLLMLAFAFWVPAELITYRRRLKRAALDDWPPYLRELLD